MTEASGKTVLVVEDNDLNMRLFCDLLSAHGYRTVSSSDGSDVPSLMRTRGVSLVVMDIQLPSGSGLEITRQIKEDPALAHVPVLAVTAFAMRQDEELAREAGCEAYLSKPIQMVPFIKLVEELAGAPS